MLKKNAIDRAKRDLLAEKLRQLISGAISNQDYDNMELDGEFDSDDLAVSEIWFQSWGLYDDFSEHPIEVDEKEKTTICRWILFLKNDFEYRWERYPWYFFVYQLIYVLSFFRLKNFYKRKQEEYHNKQGGDFSVWPFFLKSECEYALQNPKLLSGVSRENK